MESPSYTDFSPIAALATAPGQSALAVIRVSGEGSVGLLARCFSRPRALAAAAGNTVVYGWIVGGGVTAGAAMSTAGAVDARAVTAGGLVKIDEVLVSVYRAPASYTGEEGADICCHGGSAAPRAVLRVLFANGFREALRGEFSYRAFINGKIGLSRAEAVMEIVAASGSRALAASVRRLAGTLEAEINAIKNLLLAVITQTELLLDYSEVDGVGLDAGDPAGGAGGEEAGGALPASARANALAALERLERLLVVYEASKIEREGALVVLAGAPNAGKSSLFNALLKEERAIVSPIPGTTRDWIEGGLELGGILVRLADTAGLRESGDLLEQSGVERSRALLAAADAVMYVIDGENGVLPAAPDVGAAVLYVWNKSDVCPCPPDFTVNGQPCCSVSAKTGSGLAALCGALESALARQARTAAPEKAGAAGGAYSGAVLADGAPCPGTGRQRALLLAAREALASALVAAQSGDTLDLIAPPLREALDNLGQITGEVTSADILESMFSSFCVGK